MNSFQYIAIEGYRRLFNVQVEMRPLTVMIGANGVGKTSLLEIFFTFSSISKRSARIQYF
jgi:predicted ATPase